MLHAATISPFLISSF